MPKKLCVLCPSRYRPEQFKRMLKSYEENKTDYSDIFFSFQLLDDALYEYVNIAKEKYHDKYWLFGNVGFTRKVNLLQKEYPDYDAYMVLNDDQIIHTKGFDEILMKKLENLETEFGHGIWILSWRDGINNERLVPSFATKKFVDCMGGYYPDGYMRHLYTDNMYQWIGEQVEAATGQKIIHYIPEIFIEHLHFCNQKAPVDKSYAETNSQQAYKRDFDQFNKWIKEKGTGLVIKLVSEIKSKQSESTKKTAIS